MTRCDKCFTKLEETTPPWCICCRRVAEERERCALLVEHLADSFSGGPAFEPTERVAKKIRQGAKR